MLGPVQAVLGTVLCYGAVCIAMLACCLQGARALRQKHAGMIGPNRRPVSTGCRPAAAGPVANTSMPEALAALLPADTRGDFAKFQAALDQTEIDQLQVQIHQLTVLHEDIGWTLWCSLTSAASRVQPHMPYYSDA